MKNKSSYENNAILLTGETRVKLKNKQLEMLKVFLEICQKNNLTSFVVGGTALGAIRHSGYIPWDDDIDVAMPRPDYQRFMEIAQSQFPDGLFLQTHVTDPDYRNDFAKIRNSNTTFLEIESSNLCINHGIYIDIFPIDGYPTTKMAARILETQKTLAKLYIRKDYIFKDKKCIRTLAQFVATCIFAGKSSACVISWLEQRYKKYSYDSSDMVMCHGGAWKQLERCPKEHYGKGVPGLFEGIQVVLPEKTHDYLTHKYNDYMQLPPPEKQVAHHHCMLIDFEKACYGGQK